jgi:hypothetical protein
MRPLRIIGVAVGVAALVLLARGPLVSTATVVSQDAIHNTLGAKPPQAPAAPGSCLQNAAQCTGGGSLLASGVATGAALVIVLGPALNPVALVGRARRARRGVGILPEGDPTVVMRPPRVISVFA